MVDTDDGLFLWDAANEEHVERHGVSREEAEEVLLSPDRQQLARRVVDGEVRWPVVGSSQSGRFMVVVYTMRAGRMRVVTARSADEKEKRRWRRRK